MLVKTGSVFYSSDDQPIMVVFEDAEKANVQDMPPENKKIATYPEAQFSNVEEVLVWMRDFEGAPDSELVRELKLQNERRNNARDNRT